MIEGLRVAIESVEIVRDGKNPRLVAWLAVRFEPSGVHVGNIKVVKGDTGFVDFQLPAAPRYGGWIPSVELPKPMLNLMRREARAALYAMGVLEKPAPKVAPEDEEPKPISAVPMFYDPDQIEEENEAA